MPDPTISLIQQQAGLPQLQQFATRLTGWLLKNDAEFTSSRARTLLRSSGVIDAPTLHDFAGRMQQETAVRVALHQLLEECELGESDEVAAEATAVASMSGQQEEQSIDWDLLTIAAFAFKRQYPLGQLDPASPPEQYSPAGQILKRAGYFMRQQVQRSATERDKLGRKLAFQPGSQSANLNNLPEEPPQAPVLPHYRPPIPVNYPEVARETVTVSEDETPPPPPAVERTSSITITEEDLVTPPMQPVRQPALTISEADILPPAPTRQPTRTTSSVSEAAGEVRTAANDLLTAVRHRFARSREPLTTTRLAITVQENPDGAGLQGLQVEVRCRGISSFVAGTTNQNGRFLCELPVRQHSGLTYDIDVTWPRDLGGETERKSITLNADRTQFTLPFYRRSVA